MPSEQLPTMLAMLPSSVEPCRLCWCLVSASGQVVVPVAIPVATHLVAGTWLDFVGPVVTGGASVVVIVPDAPSAVGPVGSSWAITGTDDPFVAC